MAEAKMGLVEWLDDLSVRFLLNLPPSELSSVPRLCFQVEEAQWYYEDFVRPLAAASGNPLPSLPLRAFCLALFQHCPLLSGFTDAQHIAAYEEFLAYKVRVPVRGAILLDESMERVLLVRGWKKGASWSFPRGKINKDEKDLDCAIREVYEETGYNVGASGLVPENGKDVKYFDITMREQHMRMFVFRGVPLETFFEPRTRKEIGKIDWYDLQSLPGYAKRNKQNGEGGNANKFYMVAPFMNSLKKWIGQQHRKDAAVAQTEEQLQIHGLTASQETDEFDTDVKETTPEPAPMLDRSDELKRLLSIGGGLAAPEINTAPDVAPPSSASLLAILQGGPARNEPPPQTPMEQIHAFAPIPETPQPHHLKQPSLNHRQPPPQFSISPATFQQQQRNFSVPTGPTQGLYNGGPQSYSGMPPHMQQQSLQQQHRTRLPSMVPELHRNDGRTLLQHQGSRMQPMSQQSAFLGAGQVYHGQNQQHLGVPIQGNQGAIAAGPSVPRASQLPPPKLNAHSMKLLDAFKSGNKPSDAPQGTDNAARPSSDHQSALLDLFGTPSASRAPLPPRHPSQAASATTPVKSEAQNKASAPQGRRSSTLNEFTRTLPTNFKRKPPSQPSSTAPALERQAQVPQSVLSDSGDATIEPAQTVPQLEEHRNLATSKNTPLTGQIPDPRTQAPAPASKGAQHHQPASTRKQQRPTERQPTPRHSKAQTPSARSGKRTNGSPAAPTVPFTILTRPKPDQDHLANDAASLAKSPGTPPQAQVLRRPENGGQKLPPSGTPALEHDGTWENDGKRDHLLSLFTKSPKPAISPSPAPSPAVPPPVAPTPPAVSETAFPMNAPTNQNKLLGLFHSSAKSNHTANPGPSRTPLSPPSAPQLAPSQHFTKPTTPTPASVSIPQSSQNQLLNLFKKPSSSAVGSPETPISPFTLGSPNAHTSRQQHQQFPSKLQTTGEQQKSRSFAPSGRGSPGAGGTPTEVKDKDFLLGFLNGVVLKEGGRGKS